MAAMPLTREELAAGCYAYDYELYGRSGYGYVPSLGAGIFFCVIFGIFLLAHLTQSIWKRLWWTLVFPIGALTEVIGWAGRTWSSQCPYNTNAFLMQITTLIIAPTFITAGLYLILGQMIHVAGRHTSPIGPRVYLLMFSTCDVISLVIQAVGGSLASLATSADPPKDTKPGTHIMVAGIVFQMASITVFVILFGLFVVRARKSNLPEKNYYLLGATAFSTVMIYIRSIYRTIELSEGWTGYLITCESYFIVLDGIMIVLATGVFNVIHPGWFGLGKVPFNSSTATNETTNKPTSPPMEGNGAVVE